jgi:hypothetical protein
MQTSSKLLLVLMLLAREPKGPRVLDNTTSRRGKRCNRVSSIAYAYQILFHCDYSYATRVPLCELCQNFDLHSFERVNFTPRGYPTQNLLQSPDCEFCSLLLRTLYGRDRAILTEDRVVDWIHLSILPGKPIATLIVGDDIHSPASLISWGVPSLGPKLHVFATPGKFYE